MHASVKNQIQIPVHNKIQGAQFDWDTYKQIDDKEMQQLYGMDENVRGQVSGVSPH